MVLYVIIGVLAAIAVMLAAAVVLLVRERNRLALEKSELELKSEADKAAAENRFAEEKSRIEGALRDAQVESATLRAHLEVSKAERQQAEDMFKAQFKNLANDILSEQSRHFRETNKDEMDKLLKPFKDNIVDFRERVEKIYSFENEQRGTLRGELNKLFELNRRITDETANLTKALKGDSKMQGDLGEMLLETILENSNLMRGYHYESQYSIKDEEGNNLRPDVILKLPEGKRIVVDSKMSLKAYVDFLAADDDETRARALKSHLDSVRRHVSELSDKNYQRLVESPDFVIMFIPSEAAFLTAMHNDNSIWSDAYGRKVIISSPTNLFALLKLVDDLWKRNEQSRNTAKIVDVATKLYNQLVAFEKDLDAVGDAMNKAVMNYNSAYKRLFTGNNNIVTLGERMKKLGLPTDRQQSGRAVEMAGETPDDDAEKSTNQISN